MGTSSTTKFIKNSSGVLTEQPALTTSAGAGDAQAIPALNASGILDPSIVNSVATSAGAGDSAKLPQLDSTGKLDSSFMPVGIGADTAVVVASEALAAGDLVNIWNNTGVANARKADASTTGKIADGFVLASVLISGNATVYFVGTNTQCTGLTPGQQYLSDTVPGKCTVTVPTGSGHTVQPVGVALSATSMNFSLGTPFVLA